MRVKDLPSRVLNFEPKSMKLARMEVKYLERTKRLSVSNCFMSVFQIQVPANTFLLQVNNRNRKDCEIFELTVNTPERPSGVFIVNFEYTSYILLVFLSLTLNR